MKPKRTLFEDVAEILENGLAEKRSGLERANEIKFEPISRQVAQQLNDEGEKERVFNSRYDKLCSRNSKLPKLDNAYREFRAECKRHCKNATAEFEKWYANAKLKDIENRGRL